MKRLLIVDDDVPLRQALKRWFDAKGWETTVAEGGQQAIDFCNNASFDVVIMDLQMPGISGVEATRRIQDEHPELPIVILTGYSEQLDHPVLANTRGILRKPIGLVDLTDKLEQILHGNAA
jgi:hypothetical protein